jgi:hypothetical protein
MRVSEFLAYAHPYSTNRADGLGRIVVAVIIILALWGWTNKGEK